jgi:hypothetical protein
MNEVVLDNGSKIRISLASFELGKEFYQIVSEEMLRLKMNFNDDIDTNFFKDLICVFLSSKKIENHLWLLARNCLYNDQKITKELFEDEKARGDYFEVMYQIAKRNIDPFVKALFAKYKDTFQKAIEGLKQS